MFFIFVFNSGGWECPDPLTAKGGGASYNLHHSESRHPPIDAIISFFFRDLHPIAFLKGSLKKVEIQILSEILSIMLRNPH